MADEDVLESTFAKVTGLIHSYLFSSVLLLRSPVRGALRLSMRSRHMAGRQIGPRTMLFVTATLVTLLVTQTDQLSKLMLRYGRTIEAPAEVRRALAAAFVTTAILSLGARAFALAAGRGHRLRQEHDRSCIETRLLYAAAAQATYLLAGIALLLGVSAVVAT